jgi:hypothetical protein
MKALTTVMLVAALAINASGDVVVSPDTTVVLTSGLHVGAFESPAIVMPQAGGSALTWFLPIPDADQLNPLNSITMLIDQSADGGETWSLACIQTWTGGEILIGGLTGLPTGGPLSSCGVPAGLHARARIEVFREMTMGVQVRAWAP